MKSDLVSNGDLSEEIPLSDDGDCNGKNKPFWNLHIKMCNFYLIL